ncbi:hypothetical protein MACH26_26700 [Planctobacterium marinum]|uniref:GH16 domain-containing protein n=1 Tax=Planctobacterium marinum TaxID=1631968 RepID=A0AA48HKZ5_9ALTE|nr:hypothetical protein MACH26_26700 [Planctobacterium marinum]
MVIKSTLGMKRILALSLLSVGLFGCGGGSETNTVIDPTIATPPVTAVEQPDSDWTLVWSDEFDGSAIDTNKWTLDVNCDGGGNFEQQCYTDDPSNAFVSNGVLNIVAMPAPEEAGLPLPYTSAKLTTKNKGDFTYGRFEMRAKMPQGLGTWPAFWMLPTDNVYGEWPKSGEIDIMEATNLNTTAVWGSNVDFVFGTLHYGDDWPGNISSGNNVVPAANPAENFNVYAIEWQEGEIRWYINDYLYATQRQSDPLLTPDGVPFGLRHRGWAFTQFDPLTGEKGWVYDERPFDQDFYLILNLAVGGNLPAGFSGLAPDTAIDPEVFAEGEAFEIDYVRVYECSADPDTGRGCESVRQGYDQPETLDIDLAEGQTGENAGALVEGTAPIPTLPAPETNETLVIFGDGEANSDWNFWDCCGGTEPQLVEDDERGNVVEFEILDNNGTVLGFNARDNGASFNAVGMVENGTLSFDMKVVSAPAAGTPWLLKVEANGTGSTGFAEINLNTSSEGVDPVAGEWQTFTFPLSYLQEQGLDVTGIDIIMIFPAWGSGEGAVYRIDNLEIGEPGAGSSPSLTIFEGGTNPEWPLWDCCGGTVPMEVEDEEQGTVAEFEILNNDGTVMGFFGRDTATPFNAVALVNEGVLQFDMKVVSAPAAGTPWLMKVEANGDGSVGFAEVNLNTSTEGADPATGVWQTYTFPISDLQAAGLDVTGIDIVMIFPAWGSGEGAVYRVNNLKIYNPNDNGNLTGPLLNVFSDGVNDAWPLWDCCGGTVPTVEMDDAEHGEVAEFRINDNNGTVMGFFGRDTATPFDASSIVANGVLQFEMKVENAPATDTWLLKVEANGDGSVGFAEVPLNSSLEAMDPQTGEWQTYTFPLQDLLNAGLDVTGLDIIMIFPAWGSGEGAVYRVDNVFVGNPGDIDTVLNGSGGSGGGASDAAYTIFADEANAGWPLWDCCGGTVPTVEMDDAEHGAVAEFVIENNNGTVLGFFSRDDGQPFDASAIFATGKFQFEMKVVSPPSQSTNWLLKIESNGDGSTGFAEVDLTTSNEGAAPVVGEWQTYTFDLVDLAAAGLDITAIDVVMVFPAWATGEGAVYRIDNVVFLEN